MRSFPGLFALGAILLLVSACDSGGGDGRDCACDRSEACDDSCNCDPACGAGGAGGSEGCDLAGVVGEVWSTPDCACDGQDPPFCVCYVLGLSSDGTFREEALSGVLDGYSNVDVDCWEGTWRREGSTLSLTDCGGEETRFTCERDGGALLLDGLRFRPDASGFVGCDYDHCR